jgi:hypothetical protein
MDLDTEAGSEFRRALLEHVRAVPGGLDALPDDETATAVREWARRRQLPIHDRGRIPDEIWKRYREDRALCGGTVLQAVNLAAELGGENVVAFDEHAEHKRER